MEPIDSFPTLTTVAESAPTRLRTLELGLVLFIVFSQLIATSLYVVFTGVSPNSASIGKVFALTGILMELGSLALLRYVLFRQGRSFASLGFGFSWLDIPRALWIALASYIAFIIWWVVLSQTYWLTGRALNSTPRNVEFMSSMLSVAGVIFLFINPFFEELIARAYVITEVRFLTGSPFLAVLASVLLQSSYHLYQGIVPALLSMALFGVFSLYYVRAKKIMPVILAHMLFDFLALVHR